MLKSNRPKIRFLLTNLTVGIGFLVYFSSTIFAQEDETKNTKTDNKIVKTVKLVLNGFTVGTDTRMLPYASLDDWFDPYGGIKLEHPAFWNTTDRIFHHIKYENFSEFSWKFRYLANSISTENTKISFLIKTKLSDDNYFYGIGNSTRKSERALVSYSSIFLGGEIKQNISNNLVLRWTPGFWKFKSGLTAGGEFERVSDARYLTSRFTLSDRKSIDYWKASWDNRWSAYLEMGLPVNSTVSSYARFNLQTLTRFPFIKNTSFDIATRFEFLLSPNRDLVPYFAMPEVGSRSGLRGFSKERFRNFALAALNIEYALPLSHWLDGFLLTDLAQTTSTSLLGNKIYQSVGFGFRIKDSIHPLTFGMAAGKEGWKLFSSFAIGLPW